ncbi:MAG: YbhB/YbcL family Raf kinase inhibitor-like protein [Myxococcales bacterium]|nr:YbhB/YbcL family Raf kinase inhibitor-like protein [Myxococcales bacterium]MDD9970557.1 YbhB/YbcL family Raf kinase inhibitor-like protein [Myxococcales bacterium]
MGFALSQMQLSSPAFDADGAIPKRHTGEGEDVSPALSWRDAPPQAKGFAVVCHDPDAPLIKNGSYGYVHWLLYNLPGAATGLSEDTQEGTAGVNDFGNPGYGGPMPPPGHGTHRYYFWILALDENVQFEAGLSLPQFLQKAEPNIIAMNRLIGTYQR